MQVVVSASMESYERTLFQQRFVRLPKGRAAVVGQHTARSGQKRKDPAERSLPHDQEAHSTRQSLERMQSSYESQRIHAHRQQSREQLLLRALVSVKDGLLTDTEAASQMGRFLRADPSASRP